MKNPGDVPMPEALFEDELDAQRAHILAITGIVPDERWHIPVVEAHAMVAQVQAGDSSVIQNLIASRIIHLYGHVRESAEITARDDLTLSEVLNMSCLAISEAAHTVKPDAKQIGSDLYRESVRSLGRLLTESRLVPPLVMDGTSVVAGIANGLEERIADRAVAVGDSTDVAEVERRDFGSREPMEISTPEDRVMVLQAQDMLLKGSSPTEKRILAKRYGPGSSQPFTYEEIAVELRMSRETVRKIENKFLERLRLAHKDVNVEEFSNRWLPGTFVAS